MSASLARAECGKRKNFRNQSGGCPASEVNFYGFNVHFISCSCTRSYLHHLHVSHKLFILNSAGIVILPSTVARHWIATYAPICWLLCSTQEYFKINLQAESFSNTLPLANLQISDLFCANDFIIFRQNANAYLRAISSNLKDRQTVFSKFT